MLSVPDHEVDPGEGSASLMLGICAKSPSFACGAASKESHLYARLQDVVPTDAARLRLYIELETRLKALTGSAFLSATLSNVAPMSPYHWTSLFLVEGRERENDRIVRAVAVGSNYFDAMRIPLKFGRLPGDGNKGMPRVAVLRFNLEASSTRPNTGSPVAR